jgi:hypothetical protein
MDLPLGIADPLFVCELALEMGMPISEMGQRMSNRELNVVWPAFFRQRAITQDAEAAAEAEKARSRR